jgi:glycine cleavage system regulatory protein
MEVKKEHLPPLRSGFLPHLCSNPAMRHSIIMTVLGADRPGLVQSLSETIASHNGSWQESHMVRLAGQFAGVVRIDAPSDSIDPLLAHLQHPGIPGLTIQAVREDHPESSPPQTIRVAVTGNDRPGIVRELSSAIASCGGNVEELRTGLESAPMSGHALFQAHCVISLPQGLDASAILQSIENLGPDLTADITE